ncbi:MAG: c-type cytochrome biogenesis protein CcmI [Rhodobacteraceae bacterium]|nr:c-type cytochrome biogenesis protein CcmI [Paracoccaceae bacterium]
MVFWLSAGFLTLMVGALLIRAMFVHRGGATPAAAYDLQVYRDQLKEVERDLARGVLSEAEAERVRVEVSRRLLEADRAMQATVEGAGAGGGLSRVTAAVLALVLAGGALGLYLTIGAPDYPDMPLDQRIAAADEARANRPAQEAVEAEFAEAPQPDIAPNQDPRFLELMAKLRVAVAERPNDLQGQMLLARNEAGLGNFVAAHTAQERVIAIKGDAATAQDYADYAELMIMAAGGYVSPEAEAALSETLKREPENGPARYYSGLMFAQNDRPDLAFRLWRPLLEGSQPDDPWVPAIRAQIEDLADRAGVRYELPPEAAPLRGPSAADVDAAGEMSAEDRAAMIRGMVAQLSDRLATEGGPPEEWARLIGAYGVLGETERAAAIWTEAQTVFGDTPEALAPIRAAAERAGVAE